MTIPWGAWSDWACAQKYALDPDEWERVAREARSAKEVRIVPLSGGAWAIQSNGIYIDGGWGFEEMRRQCQRMGWRWTR